MRLSSVEWFAVVVLCANGLLALAGTVAALFLGWHWLTTAW